MACCSMVCVLLEKLLCLCVLLLLWLFNVFVRCSCDVLCGVERFVVLFLLCACVFVCGSLV